MMEIKRTRKIVRGIVSAYNTNKLSENEEMMTFIFVQDPHNIFFSVDYVLLVINQTTYIYILFHNTQLCDKELKLFISKSVVFFYYILFSSLLIHIRQVTNS